MRPALPALALVATLLLAACAPATAPTVPTAPSSAASVSSSGTGVIVTLPQPNDLVASPLIVAGAAPGPWYFEASFPVRLLDGNGAQIAVGSAQAQTDWMTTGMVPFQVTLTFAPPVTATGTLVLQKDNPSGEPQNDASFSIPVNF